MVTNDFWSRIYFAFTLILYNHFLFSFFKSYLFYFILSYFILSLSMYQYVHINPLMDQYIEHIASIVRKLSSIDIKQRFFKQVSSEATSRGSAIGHIASLC